ncbi:LDHB (predicted) [Pycnogonum litorale]
MDESVTTSVKDLLLENCQEADKITHSKVTIVGVGQVGMACAFSLLTQNIVRNISLVDVVSDKLRGEMLDLQHGMVFHKHVNVVADSDYSITAGSSICVVTAGARQHVGESRLSLVQRNVDIFKSIIPELVKYSPDTIILVVSNPVDILTYVAWKLSGLPASRVIGSGTNLDTGRFRFLMSKKLEIAPSSCHGWIIGEHGDSSVPVWSGVNIAGVRLRDIKPNIGNDKDKEKWNEVHQQVVQSAYEIIKLKGYTSWGIGSSVSTICQGILSNSRQVFALSTLVQNMYGIKDEIFLSLPCVVGSNGINDVVKQTLNEHEIEKLQESAKALHEVQIGINM